MTGNSENYKEPPDFNLKKLNKLGKKPKLQEKCKITEI